MKKLIYGVLTLILMFGIQSCENKVPFGNIDPSKAPAAANDFVKKYFPNEQVLSVEKDLEEGATVYEYELSNNIDLVFDKNGDWIEVDCGTGRVPSDIIPSPILSYVEANYKDNYIVEIEKRYNRYKVELNNGVELKFDKNFNFTGDYNPTKSIDPSKVPGGSSSFLDKYFPGIDIVYAEKDEDDGMVIYELILSDGTEIELDEIGDWIEVDCRNRALPDGIVPQEIMDYVSTNYSGVAIVSIEKDYDGYEIELLNGIEIKFDRNFNVVETDDDDEMVEIISYEQLPIDAQTFISDMGCADSVLYIQKKTDDGEIEYKVKLKNGVKVEFNASGMWEEIETDGYDVPSKFIPEKILEYVNLKYAGIGVESISREKNGYEVELTNGKELYFDGEFNFVEGDD